MSSNLFFCSRNFLCDTKRNELLAHILSAEPTFSEALVTGRRMGYRKAIEVKEDPFVRGLILDQIIQAAVQAADYLGVEDQLKFAPETIECRITAYGDCDYFHVHRDNGGALTAQRALSYVYYFRSTPRSFYGGELRIYQDSFNGRRSFMGGDFDLVPPEDNCIVFFSSDLAHEVLPTYVPSQRFSDFRFTVNGWVHRF